VKQPPDILNSKIKKIRIELPHYTFSHSSSGDSPHDFIGRVRIKERLKKVIEDSPDEPGVYLIAGNRGVGKTSLVSEIIKETSLRTKTGFIENLKYLLLLLIFVVGTQFCFEQEFICPFLKSLIFWCAISFLFFIILCCFNSYRREIPKQNIGLQILDTITSAFKELSCLVNSLNPYGKTQYVLKIILVVCYTQIISKIQFCGFFPFNKSVETSQITPTKVFVFYLFFIFAVKFWQFIRGRLRRYYIRYKKDKPSKNSIYYIENKGWIWVINILFKLSSIILLFLPLGNGIFNCFTLGNFFIMLIPFYIVLILVCFWCCIYLEKDMLFKIKCIVRILFYDSIINPVRNYLKNHSRLYLRINFGHNLKEKDILRLIARTLNTEYNRYRHSFLRMSPWRIIAFFILLLFACLFTPIVEEQEFYKSLIKEKELYKASSQVLLYKIIGKKNNICSVKIGESEYSIKTKYLDSFFLRKDKKRLKRLDDIFSKKNTKIETKVEAKVETNTEYAKEKLSEHTKIETKIDAKVVDKVNTFLLALDQLVYETTKIVKKAPKFFWEGRKDFRGKYFSPINYLRCLLFLTMYLFCVLIFRCNWISPLFVTHRLIMRRLKILNSDITHSTESENSIYVNNRIAQPMIGSKVKKSRNVADAREIEKELQDILSDMQRIPFIMCRPNIVIVFDELDKVEPGESGSNKENQQTKASLFSIHATRERQTEILKILSNMKYFLSSARAKFIFIAGREMFDIHLADVSDRNNYIGSIFNVVILVPSFLTDHHMGKKYIPQESSIASLPEEFVCRKLIPYDYPVESYDLGNYRKYLKNVIYKKEKKTKEEKEEEIQKIIAVLQQFIIYLAHVSKGAPKKMMQLFESFVEIRNYRDDKKNTLLVQRYYGSFHFLSFNYYKQYTIGIVAYLITPIFYRLAESNIKEHSDKLLVSSLRFVDFLFKFHKHSFSWKHLDMSPEMLEVNRAPELKSVAVELLNYLTQVHINKSNFSLSEYKFDGLIANEIFAMAKTDEVFSALFSFSLDEMLPLKKHYQDLLEKKEKEYKKKEKTSEYIDAVSSLQGVLGDLHYYDDELEEAEAYYKSAVQGLSKSGQKKGDKMTLEQLYVYIRNMLRLGIIYEKRKQYDFAYMTYGELCKRIIQDRKIPIDIEFRETTYEGLKMLYLPFIAKIQILEKSHVGGITSKHLKQLDCEFKTLIDYFDCKGIKLLKSEFYSRVADILYYKNSDLKEKNRIEDNDEAECNCENEDTAIDKKEQSKNYSCTACYYYLKGLSALLNKSCKNTVEELLNASVEQLLHNYNVKFCTILARILSDWGNVFFSCDTKDKENRCRCYICDSKKCNTITEKNNNDILLKCIEYLGLEEKKEKPHTLEIKKLETKKDIALAMYSISSVAYHKAGLYKRSSYQIYKILYLFKYYEINNENYITKLSEKAIHYLWHANDDLNIPELNKRKKDLGKKTIKDIISLKNLLVDTEITRIRILVKELGLKQDLTSEKLNEYYKLYITSPYRINYSIVARIYRLRLKSKVNYKAYKKILEKVNVKNDIRKKDFLLEKEDYDNVFNNEECIETVQNIFGIKYDTKEIFENLIADSIYCLTDIAQLLETMEETYLFPHSFLGSIHEHLSFWIRQYEAYEIYKGKNSRIDELLDQYLGEEWREQLSGYRENQRALSHYYKCLEMHSEGRAYQNMLDIMVYIKDDFNDRSDHFNIAEERHLIVNEKIDEKIKNIKDIYKDSELYKVDNYFNEVHP
jgi:DNA polymerase III delta prime subunit